MLFLTDDQITQVKDLYRHRLLSDTEIASRLTESDGSRLSARQVQDIRLKDPLLRRPISRDDKSRERSKSR
jgi:hypothetical protein